MPAASASAAASRLAAHWVADALAGDESLGFSTIKALVGVSSDSLTGAPESVRERVALRCLQEVVSVAAVGEGEAAAPAAPATRVLRVDASRSCEDLLLELIGEVGSSVSLEKGLLLPFSQDIQKFICVKKPSLPETSFELLRQVYPDITSMVPPSPVEQNDNEKHNDFESLCKNSHDDVNTKKLGFSTDSAQLQQDDLANIVGGTNTVNQEKNPMVSTPDFHQPCTSDRMCFDQPQDAIDAVGVSISSPEKGPTTVDRNMPVPAEPSLASCSTDLLGSNIQSMSKQNMMDHTTMVQPQSCGGQNLNTSQYNDGDELIVDVTGIQSSKDSIHEEPTMQATDAPTFGRNHDSLPGITSHLPEFITAQDTIMTSEPPSSKTPLNSPQHGIGVKVTHDVDHDSASIYPVGKDLGHEKLTVQTTVDLPSESCNVTIQADNPEVKRLPESTAEHSEMVDKHNGDKVYLDVGCADKVNQALSDDGNIMKKKIVCGGLNVQTALESGSCNMALHNKIAEGDHLTEKNVEKNTTGIEKHACSTSVPISPQDGNEATAKQASNKKTMGNTVSETSHRLSSDDSISGFAAAGLLSMTNKIPFYTQDQDANGSLEGLSQQDLCIKCGKEGHLLKCGGCLLTAHASCFGSSVVFDDSGQFYCPICFYTKASEAYQKAKKTYSEARKSLSAFLGAEQLVKQHEQPAGVQQTAANREDNLNGCNASKRQDNHQSEIDNLSHRDEELVQQRKKRKPDGTSDACAQELVTEKAPIAQNSDVAPMEKHCVLQSNRKRVQVAGNEQAMEDAEVPGKSGGGNLSHGTRHSSQNRCSPAANQNVEAAKEDGLTNSHMSEDSDEIESTSSPDSGKRSSPPWRKLRQQKASGHGDQQMASPSRKRNCAYPSKRYSNPVAPTGRRSKLSWTEQEEAALRDAMIKFAPKDNGAIPWVQILDHGRDVFHRTRLPSDLRVKWRNMKKKSGS